MTAMSSSPIPSSFDPRVDTSTVYPIHNLVEARVPAAGLEDYQDAVAQIDGVTTWQEQGKLFITVTGIHQARAVALPGLDHPQPFKYLAAMMSVDTEGNVEVLKSNSRKIENDNTTLIKVYEQLASAAGEEYGMFKFEIRAYPFCTPISLEATTLTELRDQVMLSESPPF